MKTTSAIFELFIIGIGSGCCLLLIYWTLGSGELIQEVGSILPAAMFTGPALVFGVVYVMGILVDRIADNILHLPRVNHFIERLTEKGTKRDVDENWLLTLRSEGKVCDFINYSRGQLRILRAYSVLSPILLLCVIIFGKCKLQISPVELVGVFAVGSFICAAFLYNYAFMENAIKARLQFLAETK